MKTEHLEFLIGEILNAKAEKYKAEQKSESARRSLQWLRDRAILKEDYDAWLEANNRIQELGGGYKCYPTTDKPSSVEAVD